VQVPRTGVPSLALPPYPLNNGLENFRARIPDKVHATARRAVDSAPERLGQCNPRILDRSTRATQISTLNVVISRSWEACFLALSGEDRILDLERKLGLGI
jgi:hypothetical protein